MMNIKYDYLIIGSGLFGATFAYLAKNKVKSVWLSISVLI